MRIGFIGLGLMGSSMARHLLAGGFSVLGHDIDPVRSRAIVGWGGRQASGSEEIPGQVDVILLSLPNSAVVNQVVTDDLKLLEREHEGLIVIDTSTGEPTFAAELAARLRQKGVEMLDATVSGTSEMCAVKDVIFMVGGNREVFERCRPAFAAMGREVIYMGGNGAGATAKLIVNLVLGLNRMALAEGLTLARKAGLEPLQTLDVLKKSAAYSKAMDQKGMRMVEKRFLPPASMLASSYKGARLMLELGARLDCPLPLLALYTQALASEVAKGRGGYDNADIINFYNELASLA